ncbi:MAG: GAF domain-containing protein [Anaerolineae bacterium]|nr:GAF domain-containing protein [Anaerolineae bacterium]
MRNQQGDHILDVLHQLNALGQQLTHALHSPEILQHIVDLIRNTFEADLVVLHGYQQDEAQFITPVIVGGQFRETNSPASKHPPLGQAAIAVLNHTTPIMASTPLDFLTTLQNEDVATKQFLEHEHIQSLTALPLRVLDENVAVLFIAFRRPIAFEIDQQMLLHGLANYTAIAIKNAREFTSLHSRRTKELKILQDIDSRISKTLNLQDILQTILNLTATHIPTEKAAIFLYHAHTNVLDRQAVITTNGNGVSPEKIISLDEDKGITRWVFESKRPVRIDNVLRDPNWRDLYVEGSNNILSELDVPLLFDDEAIGIINFESTREAAFSRADQEFLVTLAGQVVLAIRNAQAYEQQKHLADERKALNKISQKIIGQLDSTRIFEFMLDQALEITKSEVGTLMLYDPQRGDLWMAAERGVTASLKGRRHGLHEGITGWVASNKETLNVGDITKLPWKSVHLPFIPGIRSELAIPLLEGNRLRGVINIESPKSNHFTLGDEQLLQEFADLAVITLKSAEGYREAKEGKAKLQALHNVAKEIIGQLEDPDHVMRTILKNAAILSKAEGISLHLYNDGQADDIYRAHRGGPQHELTIKHFDGSRAKRGIVAHVAETKRFYLTHGDAQNDPFYQGDGDIHCEVAVPILSNQNKLVGVLNLESPRLNAFDVEDVDLLELFAGQAVIAIQNARAYATATRRETRFRLLHEAAQKLGEIADIERLEEVFDIVARIAEKHTKSQVVIRRYDHETEDLVVVHTARWEESSPVSRVRLADPYFAAWVARNMQTLTVLDTKTIPPEITGLTPTDPKTASSISTPIKIEGRLYGTLALTYRKPHRFGDDDINLIEGLAQQLAIAIQRLEATAAQQAAEHRAMTAEVMGSIGQQAFELAHRLSNDLGLVRSYVNDIREELDGLEEINLTIDNNLQNIVHDVQQVLSLSGDLKHALTKEVDVDPAEVPVSTLLHESMKAVSPHAANAQVHFEFKEVDEDVEIYAVPKQVADIFRNLFMNAIESMPDGGKITLQTHKTMRYVEINVIDTGIGIAVEKQDRIFDLLFSTKNSTGFGLWSARRVALENGGDLILKESQPEQGTTFTLRLLRADAQFRGDL